VFDNKSTDFSRWYNQITRHLRKTFVGPAACEWFLQGGLLLPTCFPIDTPAWQEFFDEEDSIRDRLNADGRAAF
jgi:hypothetical protein